MLLQRRLLAAGTAAILLSTLPASAQGGAPDQDQMAARFAEFQTHDWFTGAEWILDLDEAKAEAKRTGKPIFAYFTQSYAP